MPTVRFTDNIVRLEIRVAIFVNGGQLRDRAGLSDW
jgi:hypothetical protein